MYVLFEMRHNTHKVTQAKCEALTFILHYIFITHLLIHESLDYFGSLQHFISR